MNLSGILGIACAALLAAFLLVGKLYLDKRTEFETFKQTAAILAKAQQKEAIERETSAKAKYAELEAQNAKALTDLDQSRTLVKQLRNEHTRASRVTQERTASAIRTLETKYHGLGEALQRYMGSVRDYTLAVDRIGESTYSDYREARRQTITLMTCQPALIEATKCCVPG